MCGACGTVSEKASELPEPGATARSQSFFDAFSLASPGRSRRRWRRTCATAASCRSSVAKLDRDAFLVARRVAAPDAHVEPCR